MKRVKSKNKHKSSDTEEDNKKAKEVTKVKKRKDKNKVKKRRKLEYATEDCSGDERPNKTKKHKNGTESEDTSGTSSEKDTASSDSKKKSTGKDRHKNNRHFKKWLILEKFDGTTPLSIFLNQLDTCARYNGWDLEDKASHLRVSLKGNAAYIIDVENLEGASYQKLIRRIKGRFGTEGQSSLYRSQFRTRRRGKETLQTLYHDINRMAGLAYPGKSSIHRKLAAIDAFIDALNDSNLRMRVRDMEPKNFDHALHIALLAEANTESKLNAAQDDPTTRAKEYSYKSRGVQNTNGVNQGSSNVSVNSINRSCDKICEMIETMCKSNVKRDMTTAAGGATATSTPITSITCYKCGNLGHYSTTCPELSANAKKFEGKGQMRCYSCQGYGHMARNCPKAIKKEEDATPAENVRVVQGPETRQIKEHPV